MRWRGCRHRHGLTGAWSRFWWRRKLVLPEADKIVIRRNRGMVAGDLEGAHVAIKWIPTS